MAVTIIGIVAVIASWTIIVMGFPAQIYSNFRRKTCGLAPPLVYSVSFTYTMWSLYGWLRPDFFLALSQTPGLVLALVVLFQLQYYGREKLPP